jgi:hypothetical protein
MSTKARWLLLVISIFCINSSGAEQSVLQARPGNNGLLRVNERLVSPNGKFYLLLQEDGNLVVYCSSGICANRKPYYWARHEISEQIRSDYVLAMQDDGNLVIYIGDPSPSAPVVWHAGLTNRPSGGAYYLIMQSDGNLVIYSGEYPKK